MYKEITSAEANNIIENREPRGHFLVKDGDLFIGIDNSTGDAWTEEFKKQGDCVDWLTGSDDAETIRNRTKKIGSFVVNIILRNNRGTLNRCLVYKKKNSETAKHYKRAIDDVELLRKMLDGIDGKLYFENSYAGAYIKLIDIESYEIVDVFEQIEREKDS
jgi:hypothetical protein